MIDNSESFNDCSNLCSLCGRCRAENVYDSAWVCLHEDSMPFIKGNIFYEGKCLCKAGHDVDCVYKYERNNVIAIEIKDQPLRNIDYSDLVAKIENCYKCACANKLTIVAFILQLSSIKNSSKGKHQLLDECERGLGANNLRISKDKTLFSKRDNLKSIKIKFDVVKCKELDDKYFNKLLV
jgi:hypothetical protein